MHVIAAKAVSFQLAMQEDFVEYCRQIVANAKALAQALKDRNVNMVSGGTDNHLILIDLRNRTITGRELETLLHEANITTNKNAVPFDPLRPTVTSGVRIGTPAVTTRGMKEKEMEVIADCIAAIIDRGEEAVEEVRNKVLELCDKFPLYD